MTTKGIMCFAVGNSNYGRMAAGLAATIKAMEDFPIALLWHGDVLSELSQKELDLFDHLIELDDSYVYNEDGSFNPIKARLYFYELTPFDETLCLDVDNAWLNKRKPFEAFAELADVPFTIQNAGYTLCDKNADQYFSVWADIQDVIKSYKIEDKRFYKTFGEWIYFKKSPEAKKFFSTAKRIFLSKPKAASALKFIGQTIPDELAFTIAMSQTEIYPHIDSYHPTTYFHIVSRGLMRNYPPWMLADKYYTISMGGSSNPQGTVKNYNMLITAAYQQLGLQKPLQWDRKKNFLAERKRA